MSAESLSAPKMNNFVIKALSTAGLMLFTSYMIGNWHQKLTAVQTEEETQTAVTQTTSTPAEPVQAKSEPKTEANLKVVNAVSTPKAETVSVTTTEPLSTTETVAVTETEPAPTKAAAKITDPEAIDDLKENLYDQIDENWKQLPTFSENLVYSVKVDQEGEVSGYESINPAASEYVSETPFSSFSDGETKDASAKFVVVLTPEGELEVSPWMGKTE